MYRFYLGLLLLLGTAFGASAQAVPELMYYKFDTPGATAVNDASSPVGTNPSPVTGLTIGGSGQFGTGLQGNAGATASNRLDPQWTGTHTGSWTISFWMDVPTPPTTRYMFGNSSGNGTFRCFIGGAANGIRLVGGVPSITLDMPAWQPGASVVTYVYDQTLGTVSGYINGVFQASASPGASYPLVGTNFVVGSQGTSIEGIMDEFRMYNRALTASEVAATWNITLPGGPCTSPPVAGTAVVSSATTCAGLSVTLGLTGNSYGTGQTYQWESAPSASGPWTPVGTPGSTASTSVTPPAGTTTYYHAVVTCGASSVASSEVSVTVPAAFPGGTYTINSAVPTGSGNFQTFADAVSAISCGIAGPVTFNVASGSGPYNEQVELSSTIGSNATNTVTFNGNGAILTNTLSTTGTNYATLNLDGADYITFNNLTIEALGNYGFAVHLMNSADNNTFNNCTINASTTATGTTSGCVSMSGSTTVYSTAGANGSDNTFSGCTLTGGYFGFAFYGNSPAGNMNNNIINCSVKDFYYYGNYNIQQGGGIISGSTFERPTRATVSSFYCIYLSTGCTNMLVEKNRLRHPFAMQPSGTSAAYAIYVSAASTVGNENKVFNNVISDFVNNGTYGGLYLSGATHIQAYHNTISFDDLTATAGTTYGIYATGTAGVDIRNNLVNITRGGSGTKYAIYFSGAGKTSNNNNLFITPASNHYTGYYSTTFPSLNDWQTANSAAWDQNSVAVLPMFTNPAANDYTPSNSLLDDQGAPVGVTTDILGSARSATTPDIGAYEFSVPPCVGTPTAGTAAANTTSVCPGGSVILTLSGFSVGNGISITWEESPAGANFWTPIPGANTATLNASFTAATDYRATVTCAFGGGSDMSNVVSVAANPMYLCYCSPLTGTTLHTSTGNYITSVSIPGTPLSVSTPTLGAGAYTQHDPTVPTNTASLIQGQSYTLNATITSASYGTELWIDWDQNGNFDASEYQLLVPGTVATANITVPITAVPGMTGMRLRNYVTTAHGAAHACTSVSSGRETEDFAITIVQAVQCSGVPTVTGTAAISEAAVCLGTPFDLDLSNYTTDLGVTLQWQESPAGANNWTDITGATTANYTVTTATANTDYRAAVICGNPGGGTAYSNTVSVTVNNPQLAGTTPATRCGTGTVTLAATATGGATVNWYAAATGGPALGTGTSFTTPVIASTTTFYAAASLGGSSGTVGLSDRVGSTTNSGYSDIGLMFDALTPFTLQSVAMYPVGTGGNVSVTIQLKDASGTVLQSTVASLPTSASPGTKTVVPLNFAVPAGSGHRLVLGGATGGGITGFIRESTTGFTYPYTLPGVASITSAYSGGATSSYYYYLYDWQVSSACEGSRVPVVATVTAAPAVTVSANPATICMGSTATLTATSANPYTYTWTPGGTGSSVTVSPAATTKYYLDAVDGNNCAVLDSVEVSVISVPATVATIAAPLAICVTGNVNLSLDPVPMAGVDIQWQKNTGSGFVNIPGANTATYTEAVTANTTYQAVFTCNSNTIGTSTPAAVTYSNPQIIETFPGSRCDAGPVTLAATAAPGATINWYAASTGGVSLATGGAFTTPSIAATTTYYVSATQGGGSGSVGPVTPQSVGPGGGTNAAIGTYHVAFDVLVPTTLLSVDIFPTAAIGSNGAIAIQTSSSTNLITVPYTTTVTGGATPQTIPINLPLLPGTGYKIGQSTAIALFRNTSGASYPYTSSAINITSNNFNTGYHYYFYNWQFTSGCESALVPVAATINGSASGTTVATGGTTTGALHADGTTVDYMDGCNEKVATVVDAAGGNVLGMTSAIAVTAPTVQTFNTGAPFVPRVVDITPASDGPATVTLYALQSEFNAYNTYVTTNSLGLPLLPTSPTDVAGMNNIVITQFHGGAAAGTTGPLGLYDVTNASFIPNASITASSNGTYWTLTFPVTGFSGFFIHSGNTPLDMDLRTIAATNVGSRNRVDWTSAKEVKGDVFELERSADGEHFTYLGKVAANGQPSAYSYWDEHPYEGVNYYRLKMKHSNGGHSYSRIVNATVRGAGAFGIEAYPNPVSDVLTVKVYGATASGGSIHVMDVTGKLIKSLNIVNGEARVDMSSLANGAYIIRYTDKARSETLKVNKF